MSNTSTQEGLAPKPMGVVLAASLVPWRCVVRFECFVDSERFGGGTGFFVSDQVVITAGHCLFERGDRGWPDKVQVLGNGEDRKVIAESRRFRSTAGWVAHGDLEYDYGAILLDEPVADLGYFGLFVLDESCCSSALLHAAGFPSNAEGFQEELCHGAGSVRIAKKEFSYRFFGGKGCSGSPVWVTTTSGHRLVVGIHHRADGEDRLALRIIEEIAETIGGWISESSAADG